MNRVDKDLYPFFIVLFLSIVALVLFWSVLDMVILAASLAVILLPLHHRLLRYTRPALSAVIITFCLMILLAGAAYVTLMILQANTGLFQTRYLQRSVCGSKIPQCIRAHSGFRSARIRLIYGLLKEMHSLLITGQRSPIISF